MKAREIADFMGVYPKPAFYGVLHDVGKLEIPYRTLTKPDFSEFDMQEMETHPTRGYALLREEGYLFSAWIALTHHRFQERKYPKVMPRFPFEVCEQTNLYLLLYPRIVSLADHFDALHRRNDKYGKLDDPEAIRKIMLKLNKDQKCLIENLYEAGVFS